MKNIVRTYKNKKGVKKGDLLVRNKDGLVEKAKSNKTKTTKNRGLVPGVFITEELVEEIPVERVIAVIRKVRKQIFRGDKN